MTTNIIGIELVEANEVFENEGVHWFSGFASGFRNFVDQLTVTAFAAVVVGGMASAPTPGRTLASLGTPRHESSLDEREWRSSVASLEVLIADMASGARPKFADELHVRATSALAALKVRPPVGDAAWAKALASDVADADD
jgi:hypothetical protein